MLPLDTQGIRETGPRGPPKFAGRKSRSRIPTQNTQEKSTVKLTFDLVASSSHTRYLDHQVVKKIYEHTVLQGERKLMSVAWLWRCG